MTTSRFTTAFVAIFVLTVSQGCQSLGQSSSQTLGQVVDAEVAVAAGDLAAAAKAYEQAALGSQEPATIEAAAEFVFEFGSASSASKIVEHWRAVEPANPEPPMLAARLALRANEAEQAAVGFREFLALAPAAAEEIVRPYDVVTGALAGSGNHSTVLAVAEALVDADPDNWRARQMFSRVALRANDQNLAMEAAEIAFELAPESFDAALLQAESIALGGDQTAALEFIRAMADTPLEPEQRLAYAGFLASHDQFDDSVVVVETLLEELPTHAPARSAMALLALRSGDSERAWDIFSELANEPAEQHQAVYYLATLAEREGRVDQAIRLYTQVGAGPRRLAAEQRVSQLLLREGNAEGAVEHLERLADRDPEAGFRLLLARASLARELERYDDALALYAEGLEVRPDSEAFLLSRGEIFIEQEMIDDAVAAYREALARHPDSALTLNALGYTLADRTERYEEAHELIARALELDPDNPAIIDSMGWAEFRLGNFELALGYLERAWSLMKDPEVAAHLGETLWRLGRRDEARAILKEAYDRSPDSKPLRRTLERLLKEAGDTTS